MSKTIDLKETERQVWTAYFADGLWDIFMGAMLLTTAVRTLSDSLWSYLIMAAGLAVFIIGKKTITEQRLGHVKFQRRREIRRLWLVLIIALGVLITLGLYSGFSTGVLIFQNWIGLALVVFVTAVFLLMAYLLDFTRMVLYALFFGGAMLIQETIGDPAAWIVYLITGTIALLIGLVLFVRFLRHYPVLKEFDDDSR